MSNFYQYHLFVCTNQREGEEAATRPCCANYGASQILTYLKRRIKALGVSGVGKVRISRSGCLGRCEEGPVIVVYPEGVWYTYVDESDVDEIIDSHLLKGKIVKRLLLSSSTPSIF